MLNARRSGRSRRGGRGGREGKILKDLLRLAVTIGKKKGRSFLRSVNIQEKGGKEKSSMADLLRGQKKRRVQTAQLAPTVTENVLLAEAGKT